MRRELPHPGATLDAFEIWDGYRYQAFSTINTARGQLAFLPSPASGARPRRGPDPDREGHRHRAPALQAHPHQCCLGRARADRRGPARAGPVDAAHRPARAAPGRTPRRCATGCCTSPPASPAANARCSCAWPSTGPGRSRSPGPSPVYGTSRSRPDRQHHRDPTSQRSRRHRTPRRRPPCSDPKSDIRKINNGQPGRY